MPKRKLSAAETARALTAAAGEQPVVFDASHYGPLGLNGRFESPNAIEFFAGGVNGGGGKFEDAEERDIAGATGALISVCEAHGLSRGATVIDVGAGTGLLLESLSHSVGPDGRVFAIELSSRFVAFLHRRATRHGLANVSVRRCDAKSTELPSSSRFKADLAVILDVYHHFEYPLTFMRSLREALREGGKVVLVDYYRDPSKMISHPPSWALDHLRADRDVFVAEVVSVGFKLVASPEMPELRENYCVVFERAP